MSEGYTRVTINSDDILKYSYYDDNGKLVAILDEEYLKEIFKADIIEFSEKYRIDYID